MKKKILIVEDQLATRKLLTHYLSAFYEVMGVETAEEALQYLESNQVPSLIVADVMMPGMSGIDFLKHLQDSKHNKIQVMMLSGGTKTTDKIKCLQLGAKDYVVKPFNPEELQLRISNLIGT